MADSTANATVFSRAWKTLRYLAAVTLTFGFFANAEDTDGYGSTFKQNLDFMGTQPPQTDFTSRALQRYNPPASLFDNGTSQCPARTRPLLFDHTHTTKTHTPAAKSQAHAPSHTALPLSNTAKACWNPDFSAPGTKKPRKSRKRRP